MDTDTCSTKLQDLNEDCLRYIFQYLSFEDKWRFYKVCSEWTNVSPGFWRVSKFGVVDILHWKVEEHPDLMINRKLNFEEFREIILSCGPTFQELLIWLGNHPNDSIKLVYSFDGTAFFIDGEFSYEATLDILIEACQDLKTLMIYARKNPPHLAEKFHALFLSNEKLAEVHWDCCTETGLYNLARLKDVPGRAKTLYLGFDTSNSVADTNVNIICDLLESKKVNLKRLSLSFKNTKVASRLLQAVVNHAKELAIFEVSSSGTREQLGFEKIAALGELEKLSLDWNENITDEIIFAITDGCKKLKKAELSDCPRISNGSINKLMKSLPALESVVLKNLKITAIVQSYVQWTIQRLEVSACNNVSEDEYKKISVFRNLKELSICSGSYNTITDGVILAISVGCRKLNKVTLLACYEITTEGLNTLNTLPMLKSVKFKGMNVDSIIHDNSQTGVQSLKLSYCENLSEDGWKKISLFKNLEVLHMHSANNMLTDEAISTISLACKKLKTVSLKFFDSELSTAVTSEGINTLVSALPNLEILKLKRLCLRSTFLKGSQESNLQRLTMVNDGSFSNGDLESFLSKMPKLKHVDIRELNC